MFRVPLVIVMVLCAVLTAQAAPAVGGKDPLRIEDKTLLPGTSDEIENVFKGRCQDFFRKYSNTESHDSSYNANPTPHCDKIWEAFLKAWGGKDICKQVKAADYEDFFRLTGSVDIPLKDKILFWTAAKDMAADYAKHGQRAFSLADTFTGYLVTDLNWCGDPKSKDGIRYGTCQRCRVWSDDTVTMEGFEVFWARASELFAKRAVGEVRHLVTGTAKHWRTGNQRPAFDLDTFFYKNELPNLDPRQVSKLKVILANNPKLTVMQGEHCGTGSLKLLQDKITEKGVQDGKTIPFECIENPPDVLALFQ